MIKNISRGIWLVVFSFIVVLSTVATEVTLVQPPKPLVQKPMPVPSQIPSNVFETHLDAALARASNVLNNKINQISSLYVPYARVLNVTPQDEICFMGDIHGSIDALNDNIQELIAKDYLNGDLTVKKNNFFMVFLGDYVDHGTGGISVWNKLMTLHEKNPNNVILLAGNHESVSLNLWGGFWSELTHAYGTCTALLSKIAVLYSTLPTVLFIVAGKKIIQCCHGGFDLKFNVLDAVKDSIKNNTNILAIADYRKNDFWVSTDHNEAMEKHAQGDLRSWFSWIDFGGEEKSLWSFGRGIKLGTAATKKYITTMSDDSFSLACIIRGHQHYGAGFKLLGKIGDPQDYRNIVSKDMNNNDLAARSKMAYVCSPLAFSSLGNVLTFSTATGNKGNSFFLCYDNCFGMLKINSWTLTIYEKRVHGS